MDGILLEKVNRATAWIAFAVIAVFIATGFGSVGMWGMDSLIGRARSQYWHNNRYLAYLLVLTLAVHGGVCVYRRLKRYALRAKANETSQR